MNVKFMVRSLLLSIPVALLVAGVWIFFQTPFVRPLDPTPPPPTILAPRGEMPAGTAGFQEWVRYRGRDDVLGGSGFLLRLDSGEIVGVTTAHSASATHSAQPVDQIGFKIAGQSEFVAEFDTLKGLQGHIFTVEDMTTDYTILKADQSLAGEMVLAPDPRGAPQPGERVTLLGGVNGEIVEGTVQSVDERTVWVLMDRLFMPALMSGSPVVSQHSGRVVGMVVAGSPRSNRLLLGLNPIGAIVHHAESATEYLKLHEVHEGAP